MELPKQRWKMRKKITLDCMTTALGCPVPKIKLAHVRKLTWRRCDPTDRTHAGSVKCCLTDLILRTRDTNRFCADAVWFRTSLYHLQQRFQSDHNPAKYHEISRILSADFLTAGQRRHRICEERKNPLESSQICNGVFTIKPFYES